MSQIDIFDEIIVDNFAGGGGASTGIELAAGRPVAIAINHDPDAILLHKTNHPYTEHLQASVWELTRWRYVVVVLLDWHGSPRTASIFPRQRARLWLTAISGGLLGLS